MAGPFDFFTPGEWSEPGLDPRARAALLQTGIALSQPRGWGQSGFGALTSAIGSGAEAMTRQEELDRRQQEVDSKAQLREAQADSATSRARTAEMGASVAQERLGLSRDRLLLDQERYRNEADLSERKFAAQKADAEQKLGLAKTAEERKAAQLEIDRIDREAKRENDRLRTTILGRKTDQLDAREQGLNSRLDTQTRLRVGLRYAAEQEARAKAEQKLRQNIVLTPQEKALISQPQLSYEQWLEQQPELRGLVRPSGAPSAVPSVAAPTESQAPAQPPAKSQSTAPLPLPKDKSGLQLNKVYQTGRGPLRWNGTAFEDIQ